MSLPIKEQIVQAVAAKLATITTAAGYAVDVASVVRPRRTGERFVPESYGIILLQGDETPSPEDHLEGYPAALGWRLPLSLDLVVRVSEKSTQPMDQVLNVFEADVRKAVMQDVTWGGIALDTALGQTQYPDGGDGVEGVTVWIEITYRVAENDPTVNRA